MSHHDEYRQWPFLTQEEFELACALFDKEYVRAELGHTRRIFKIRPRRNAATGTSFIEIIRLICLPEEDDELSLAFGRLNGGGGPNSTLMMMDVDRGNEDTDEVSTR
jgi:ubiquitin-like-conjugating enzyme ATG10